MVGNDACLRVCRAGLAGDFVGRAAAEKVQFVGKIQAHTIIIYELVFGLKPDNKLFLIRP